MNSKWFLRAVVAAILAVALWVGWQRVRPPQRLGDVPYVQTPPEVVDRMLELAAVSADDVVYDLGSGDGRIVIRAAQRFGARGRGFELDRLLVLESRRNAAIAGVGDRAQFIEGDLFDADLRAATVVTLYLLPTVNLALRPRLLGQLAVGTSVVSHSFDMGSWAPDAYEELQIGRTVRLFLWVVPAGLGGVWNVEISDLAAAAQAFPPSVRPRFRLLQRFQELDGEMIVDRLGVPVTGRINGESVAVEATRELPGLGRWRLTGLLREGGIEGEMSRLDRPAAGGSPLSVRASRQEADVAGEWDVGGTIEPAVPEWSFRLVRDGTRWVATRWQPNGNEQRVDDLYVWGSSISFFVAAGDGSARRVGYHGLVEGDRISGVLHDGAELIPWTARRR